MFGSCFASIHHPCRGNAFAVVVQHHYCQEFINIRHRCFVLHETGIEKSIMDGER